MEKAEYPVKMCRQPVWGANDAAYHCELPDMHPGPCASFSVQQSVQGRDAWEGRNPDWKQGIGSDTHWT